MYRFARLLAAAWILVALPASAFTPESGFYNLFSSDAKGGEGTGIAIEIVNDYMFAAGFVFRPDGKPTYVTIEGQLQQKSNGAWVLNNDRGLASYTAGQCIGSIAHCPYRSPSVQSIGGFSIEFSAENEGRLEWGAAGDQASVSLRRTCVGNICSDAPGSLVGQWDVIIEHALVADGLGFGGDKLAIAKVGAEGNTREIVGCIAPPRQAAPDCSNAAETIEGNAEKCLHTPCFGVYQYRIAVRATRPNHPSRIVRVYTFTEKGNGGAFSGTIVGKVDLCPSGMPTIAACSANKGVAFVAYRSASVNFVRSGTGAN